MKLPQSFLLMLCLALILPEKGFGQYQYQVGRGRHFNDRRVRRYSQVEEQMNKALQGVAPEHLQALLQEVDKRAADIANAIVHKLEQEEAEALVKEQRQQVDQNEEESKRMHKH